MIKILRFLIDHRLENTGLPLKAYSIAVDALGRSEGFDSQIDSYPRVQVGRLRRMLDHFYLREGGAFRLAVPYNRYEIVLERNTRAPSAAFHEDPGDPTDAGDDALLPVRDSAALVPATRRSPALPMLLALFLVIILGGAVTYYLMRESGPGTVGYPALVVAKPQGTLNEESQARVLHIENYLTNAVERFEHVRLYEEGMPDIDAKAYRIETFILDNEARDIRFRLVDGRTKEVLWSDRIMTAAPDTSDLDAKLTRLAVGAVGIYGFMAQQENVRLRGNYEPGYPCILQFHHYVRFREEAQKEPALECIMESAKRYPNDAYIMSMLAVAKAIADQSGLSNKIEGTSATIAAQAVKLDSQSASAAFAVAQAAFFAGDCQEGVMAGKHAVELNPYSSRISGYLGMYMLGCNMPEGKEYTERALAMDPNVDHAIAGALAIQRLQLGDAEGARSLAMQYMATAPKYEPALEVAYTLSSAALGDTKEARRSWKRLTQRFGLPENTAPRVVMRKWIANPNLIRETEVIFERVGWQ